MFKKVFGGNLQQQALEAWAHKRKAQEMREELRQYISLYYGPSAWDEIVRIEADMRRARKDAEYAAVEKKEAIQQGLFIALSLIVSLAFIGGLIYWIGPCHHKGRPGTISKASPKYLDRRCRV